VYEDANALRSFASLRMTGLFNHTKAAILDEDGGFPCL
jgi:hypothetical protein